jgi:hypothetical protein
VLCKLKGNAQTDEQSFVCRASGVPTARARVIRQPDGATKPNGRRFFFVIFQTFWRIFFSFFMVFSEMIADRGPFLFRCRRRIRLDRTSSECR